MDIEFFSQEELFKRVKPALIVKKNEIKVYSDVDVKLTEIWKYLIQTKWKKGENLSLCDIVDDILNLDNEEFIENK